MLLVLVDDRCAGGVGVKRNMPPLWAATTDILLSAGRLSTILVRAFCSLAAQEPGFGPRMANRISPDSTRHVRFPSFARPAPVADSGLRADFSYLLWMTVPLKPD